MGYLLFSNSSALIDIPLDKKINMMNSIQNISLYCFGFLLTSLTLLTALLNLSFIEKMQEIGQFKVLLKTIFWSCAVFLLLVILTFIVPFFNSNHQLILFKITLIILCISLVLFFDIGKKFWFVLMGINKK